MVSLSMYLFISTMCLSVCLSFVLSTICLSVHSAVHPFIHASVYLSCCLSVILSIYLSIYHPIQLYSSTHIVLQFYSFALCLSSSSPPSVVCFGTLGTSCFYLFFCFGHSTQHNFAFPLIILQLYFPGEKSQCLPLKRTHLTIILQSIL